MTHFWNNLHQVRSSSGTLNVKILESQIILKCLGARKPKGLKKQNSQNRLRLPMPEGGEP
jgi:hypothetical protein